MNTVDLRHGDCAEVLKTLADESVDACVTDPIYPEIRRNYGYMTEADWHQMMDIVIPEVRRILRPTGSAVFILQPNSATIGRMRLWVWEFMVKWGRQWNLIQDSYWWNVCALTVGSCDRKNGLLRPSVKQCVWLGAPECHRNQDAVLWAPKDEKLAWDKIDYAAKTRPSGHRVVDSSFVKSVLERGGSTPHNLIPMAGSHGKSIHGARTPHGVADWWIRYICPPGGTVLDPFMGIGSIGETALDLGRNYVGIERMKEYFDVANTTLPKRAWRCEIDFNKSRSSVDIPVAGQT